MYVNQCGGIGIQASGNITLGWTNPTDHIYANSYSNDPTVKDGQATMTIPFAKSDAKGAWRIEATDVLTGESRVAEITR